ncbi:MAG: glycosyltransferase family 4 protein [SAR202 cluster bacterium]|jgi:hypothetical protein|nr:glycosyltransferase family 4 protein [SAR202 cluster bacterium]
MAKTRIAHVTSVHSAFDIRIFHKECRTLTSHGYEVILIAPNERDEERAEVTIKAVPLPSTRRERILKTTWDVCRKALELDCKVCHFHDPELLLPALLWKLHGKKVIYDLHENFPQQILEKEWVPSYIRLGLSKFAEALEGCSQSCFDGLVAATPVLRRRFSRDRTVLVQNFPILDEWRSSQPFPHADRPLQAVYLGGISELRGSFEMVQAFSFLREYPAARLVLAGRFNSPDHEERIRKSPGWERVEFLGWKDRKEIPEILNKVRAGLVIIHRTPYYMESQPTKLYEYMAAGIPVIASDFPLWRELVSGVGCGLLVNPERPEEIAGALRWLFEHPDEAEEMGKRGREAVASQYNWETEGRKLVAFYDSLLS